MAGTPVGTHPTAHGNIYLLTKASLGEGKLRTQAFAMGRKSKTQQLTESILGQHLALAVAAHLARTQLVLHPPSGHDTEHMTEMLDVVGNALARVAPLYVHDPITREPRQLMEGELEGARVKRGATLLVLRDGRSFTAVTIKRADLRQAIGILKAVGIPELANARKATQPHKAEPPDGRADLRERLAELEKALNPPLLDSQIELANRLLVSIARQASEGRVANLAMRMLSAVHDARASTSDERQIDLMLAQLRAAVAEQDNQVK
jgi:hypothetical protein